MVGLTVEEEENALGGLLHPVGVPLGEIGPRRDPQVASLAPRLAVVHSRLGDTGGAAAAVGLHNIDLAPVVVVVRPQPDAGEESLSRLRETCPGLQGAVDKGEQPLRGDKGLVDVAQGRLLVEAVLEALEGGGALAPQDVPDTVADAVCVMGEHPPVVAGTGLGL